MLIRVGSVFVLAVLVCAGGTAFAGDLPTVHQIYEAAQAGRLNEAEGMIQRVLKEHPNSAKAHYVDAEILARAGQAADARSELNIAERLAPGLPFVKPESVQELEAGIDQTSRSPVGTVAPANPHGAFPWGWLFFGVGVLALIALIMRAMARQRAPATAYPATYQGGMASGTYMPTTPAAPGMGSNILSGLATGAALGAGMVAGEELVRHFTEGNANVPASQPPVADGWDNDPNRQLGGTDFGMADNSTWNDSSGLADVSGGDDWT